MYKKNYNALNLYSESFYNEIIYLSYTIKKVHSLVLSCLRTMETKDELSPPLSYRFFFIMKPIPYLVDCLQNNSKY